MGLQADEVFPLSPPKKIASIYTPDLALGTEGEQRGEQCFGVPGFEGIGSVSHRSV